MNSFDEDEDVQLMLRFQAGEESCFEQLVERHKTKVFQFVYRYLGNYQGADDIAQEVFINVYHSRKSYKPKAKFTTWLYVICKNTCLKTLRRKNPATISIDDHVVLEDSSPGLQIADSQTPSPSDSILLDEKNRVIKDALDSLPANQRMTVILYRYDQLSYDEIAKIMGCSAKAVKSLLHRAKLNLKDKLAGYFKK